MMIVFKFLFWGLLTLFLLSLPRWILSAHYAGRILSPEEARSMPTAVVFGAGLRRDGRPTTVLADRVSTAVSLYQQGKVKTLLMSGSSSPPGRYPCRLRRRSHLLNLRPREGYLRRGERASGHSALPLAEGVDSLRCIIHRV